MGEIVIQINGGMMINVGVSVKSVLYVKKIVFGILLHTYLDDSAIICDEIINSCNEETDFNEKKQPVTQNFYILLAYY